MVKPAGPMPDSRDELSSSQRTSMRPYFVLALAALTLSVALAPNALAPAKADAWLPSSECGSDGSWTHCYSIAFETSVLPNGGSAMWVDANYSPDCFYQQFIYQDFWFVGPIAQDDKLQWSEFGHRSCGDYGHGGQWWAGYTALWHNGCGCRWQGFVFRISVSTEQLHRYEIRANGNGTQTWQIDGTQLYTGMGYNQTPFAYVHGSYLETGVEVVTHVTKDVAAVWGREVTNMTLIPGSCGCNNVHWAWNGPINGPDCGGGFGVRTPDECTRDWPLDGRALSLTRYQYWGNW